MKRKSLIRTLAVAFFVGFAAIVALAQPQEGSLVNSATPAAGQSTTLLPDGNLLLVGGFGPDGRPLADVVVFDVQRNEPRSHAILSFPRSWHTATVLPDGTVLILGGIGADSLVVAEAEIFDPASSSVQTLASRAPLPRVFHSATLLTDGRVLIAGGVGPDGNLTGTAELWDPRQKTSSTVTLPPGRLGRNQRATLLADGRVLLSDGKNEMGKPLPSDMVFDPQSQTFSSVPSGQLAPSASATATQTTVFSPQDAASDVPVTVLPSMRFSRPLQIQSVNDQTVALSGPFGIVDARVIGAEGGMLAFINPNAPLLPGTTYTLRVSGAMDTANAGVAFAQFTFTTAGEAAPDDLWVPTADWMIHGSTSRWQSLPPLQAPPGVVALAGQVLKLDGTPLARVTLQIAGRTAERPRAPRWTTRSAQMRRARSMTGASGGTTIRGTLASTRRSSSRCSAVVASAMACSRSSTTRSAAATGPSRRKRSMEASGMTDPNVMPQLSRVVTRSSGSCATSACGRAGSTRPRSCAGVYGPY